MVVIKHRCYRWVIGAFPALDPPPEKHVIFSQPFGKEHVSRKENQLVTIAKVDEKIA